MESFELVKPGRCFWAACNPAAQFVMVRGLQPADPSDIVADRLGGEQREIMLIGHMPNPPRLLDDLLDESGQNGVKIFSPTESWRLKIMMGGDLARTVAFWEQ
ncbi:MAG: hypothetical protein CM1200mP25_0950 [Acidobacteriota bacterium]|nr:MAG: hypothetical protein CM1200mP25_0950 [Acidobacteriota bacterium]